VPLPRWDPHWAFLWNGRYGDDSLKEKQRPMDRFQRRCIDRGASVLEDAKSTSPLQETMQTVANYLRAITEVVPRDQRKDLVVDWKAVVLSNIVRFEEGGSG
jgi:hypothetical protein